MQPEMHSLAALHTFTSEVADSTPRENCCGSISACVDYLIWTVQTAAHHEELRGAKAMLEQAIELYFDEVTTRIAGPQTNT
jgi:hypothetical protein